jgi:putative membrane-bound dehydrogenase-like protein
MKLHCYLIILTFLAFPGLAAEKKGVKSNSESALQIQRWSGDLNVPDPVAITVDPAGRVYVTSTTRRKVGDLDIREHPMWVADDVSLTSVDEKEAFLKSELAPGKVRSPRGGLADHNKDGSIDWKDLTFYSERIYQLRDTDDDGTADQMTVFAEGFNSVVTGIAAGVLYHDGWVYATIAPDLWRLRDTNDDGVADEREIVAHGFGMHIAYAGHDMHGPRVGPDGRIYWSIGDKGVNVTSKEGKQWFYPHEGCVLRCEPDGTGLEVFAHGLRNVQEVAFDDYGNLFGVDNDADMPGERERFVYITELSDSGWRCGHQYQKTKSRWVEENLWKPAHPGQPRFITPPLANYSNGPAGFVFEPGTALGASLRGHFILNQFPSGQMNAFQIVPAGSSFRMTHERLVHAGTMGIGLAITPGGALITADWDGGYPLDQKGAVWTADDPSAKENPRRAETAKLIRAGFEAPQVELLGHADQRVRLGTQFALVKKGDFATPAAVALNPKAKEMARIHAIWGLGQGLRAKKTSAGVMTLLLKDGNSEVLTQAAKMMGDAEVDGSPLIPLLNHSSPRVRFHAAIALGKRRVAAAEKALLAAAAKDGEDPFLRHAIVTGLAGCAEGSSLASRVAGDSENVRLCCLLALARQSSPRVSEFLADPNLADDAERAIHDDAGIPAALPALIERSSRRGLNACLRLGKPEPVLSAALTSGPLQSEALDVLLAFTSPPRLDRIDGHAHAATPRDVESFAALVQKNIDVLLAIRDGNLKAKAVELLMQLKLRVEPGVLAQIIADKKARAPLRAEALKLISSQHASSPEFKASLDLGMSKTAPIELRREALKQLFLHQPDRAIAEAASVLETGDVVTRQFVFSLLAESKDDGLITQWLDRMMEGKAPADMQLDILEAAAKRDGLREKLAAIPATHQELIEGGQVLSGREIVTNHLGANCIACHTVEAREGSLVGPSLKQIGTQKDRRYLLESLLSPTAVVAPGYGLVSVILKDGKNIAGTLDREDPKQVRIRMADASIKIIPRDQITTMTPPMSIMPPMLGILTKRQIRDVVAYLASLKTKKK